MFYEVRTYATREDFDNHNPAHVLVGLETRQGALDEGRLWLTDHEVVKVQSKDREFIEILTQGELRTMRHTQEQLADILNRQQQRGVEDARYKRDYGHSNEDTAYPNARFPDITRQAARDAYDCGWAMERRRMNKPDVICAAVFGKGVKYERN